jgi:hypothetical protein
MASKDHLTAFECIRCEVFSTDESLSTAEQHEQMKQHLDLAHPYWDLESIGGDFQTYKVNFRRKACQRSEHFYANTTELIETNRTQFDSLNKTSQRRQSFGIIGSILLFIGVFTPIISLPFVGNMNYFQNGRGDGVIILALALTSFVITLARKFVGLWITGFGSLAVMLFTFVNFQIRMSEIQDDMETRLADNPFRGIADVAMQSIQIQWGWAVLIVGAGFLIAAAAISDERSS